MVPNLIIEACVENFEEAKIAIQNGANRIELCSALHLDGLTPEIKEINSCLRELTTPVKIMLRPRPGDFTYGPADQDILLSQISALKKLGVKHLVYASLKEGSLNLKDILHIWKTFEGANQLKSLTIHKAIDQTSNIKNEVKRLLEFLPNFGNTNLAILSSGTYKTALAGQKCLNEMFDLCQGKIELIAAGSITHHNLSTYKNLLKTNSLHGRKIVNMSDGK